MTTRISDVIVPEIFNPYVIKRSNEKSALFQSGIVGGFELDFPLNEGNRYFHAPFWKDLTGEDENLEDTDGWALTPTKISSDKDMATQLFRGKAWSATDLSKTMSGDDPLSAIAELVSSYWARRYQTALISTLTGAFEVIKDTHVNNLAIEDGNAATAGNLANAGAIVDTISKLGDAHEVLTGIAMHSVVYFNLVKQNLIETVRDADGTVLYRTYMDKVVIVDDGLPVVAGGTSGKKYTTYLFGQGAIGYAEGSPEVPTETDRDKLAGEDILINRRHFVLHPRGIKFTNNTVSKVAPSNAELALAANWSKVYEDKDIRMVAMVTNG